MPDSCEASLYQDTGGRVKLAESSWSVVFFLDQNSGGGAVEVED